MRRIDYAVCGDSDSYRMRILIDTPIEHCKVFFLASGCEIDHIRNITDERDIEKTEMSNIVHSCERSSEDVDDSGIIVDAQVLRQLVVASLDESAEHSIYGLASTGCDRRCKSHCM